MSAREKKQLERIDKLGIIAGGGDLPARLVCACEENDIEPFIVAFEGQTDPSLVQGYNHVWARLGALGTVLETLRAHQVSDLVLIGAIRRPSFSELRPDLKALEFFMRVGFKALGDNNFLGALRAFLESEGFRIYGIHKFAKNLLAAEGLVGKYGPGKEDWIDIKRGLEVARRLGEIDVGQAAIVQEGLVLGIEAVEGTDKLIERCQYLKRKGRGGVLVKMCKPQQDKDLDLPTIGPETIRCAVKAGLAGIVVHAGNSLILDPQGVAEIADKHKVFVLGLDPLQSDF